MWRAFFLAVGVYLILLGAQCLCVEKFVLKDETGNTEINIPKSEVVFVESITRPRRKRDATFAEAKEYVAARTNDTGALVLSEFTGAAEQMTEAWLINPYDIRGMKRSIIDALNESSAAAAHRMRALRQGVFDHDVASWAQDFLDSLPPEQQ